MRFGIQPMRSHFHPPSHAPTLTPAPPHPAPSFSILTHPPSYIHTSHPTPPSRSAEGSTTTTTSATATASARRSPTTLSRRTCPADPPAPPARLRPLLLRVQAPARGRGQDRSVCEREATGSCWPRQRARRAVRPPRRTSVWGKGATKGGPAMVKAVEKVLGKARRNKGKRRAKGKAAKTR